MARIVDPKKLKRIKKAAMELVVKYGYGRTTIEAIAKKAKVSTGYLYRHYSGKKELIRELIDSNSKIIEQVLFGNEKTTIKDAILNTTTMAFDISIKDPVHAKFLCYLIFDQSFEMSKRIEVDRKIKELLKDILVLGIENGEIAPKTTIDELLFVLFTVIFGYLLMNLNVDYSKEKFGEEQVKRITEIILNALQ